MKMIVSSLKVKQIDYFAVTIIGEKLAYFVKLKDYSYMYRIESNYETYITSAGNKSKRKIYFIRQYHKKLIFDDEVKKWFYSFRD